MTFQRRQIAKAFNAEKNLKLHNSVNLFKQYTQISTIHGIKHIFKYDESIYHKIIWLTFFTTCLSGAIYLIWDTWNHYVKYPVEITVVDTSHTINGELFPAITICPKNKLIFSNAIKYLKKHLENKEILNDSRTIDFLNSLVLFQHPIFYQMKLFINKSQPILKYFSGINTTELMYKSAVKCEDIFISCWWQGKPRRCCHSMFHLQRSEEGFCYSFNSLTSEKYRDCISSDVYQNKIGCRLKRNSLGASGPTTGAEIFVKFANSLPSASIGEKTNIKVQAHHPYELPEAGTGILLPIDGLNKVNMAIKVTITQSTNEIRRLKLNDRNCLFKNEYNLNITNVYSKKSCLIQCRLNYIIKKCHCLPYYFNNYYADEDIQICGALELHCIVSLNEDLRFYKPPIGKLGLNGVHFRSPLDCSHCLPTCNAINYEISSELTKDFYTKNRKFDGYIDIYYKATGAVIYKRDVSYNHLQLLVNLGGIAGLFLGGSLLSILEVLFWILKAVVAYISDKSVLAKKKKAVRNSVMEAWIR